MAKRPTKPKKPDAAGASKGAPLVKYLMPPSMQLLSTDVAIIQHSVERGLFYLTFFQTRAPLDEHFSSVDADCVARLALTPTAMAGIVGLLNSNLGKYRAGAEAELAKMDAEEAGHSSGGKT